MDKVQCDGCRYQRIGWCDKLQTNLEDIPLRECSYFEDGSRYNKIYVVLTAYVRTSYEDYTHIFKTVEVEIPKDGNEWHVCGEAEAALKEQEAQKCLSD